MLRAGILPAFIHGVGEYVLAVVLIGAPFVLSFESDAATATSIVVGIGVLVVTASTLGLPTSLAKVIPIGIHVVLDVVVAAVLIAAPFLFGFSAEGDATTFFIVLGVVHLLVTIATRFLPAQERAAA